jgi:hypothetical protein
MRGQIAKVALLQRICCVVVLLQAQTNSMTACGVRLTRPSSTQNMKREGPRRPFSCSTFAASWYCCKPKRAVRQHARSGYWGC